MNRLLVVGVGNPLREDDGVGWYLAEALGQAGVPTHTCHQLLPELAAELSQVDLVLFADARAGETPGQVQLQALAPSDRPGYSHHLDAPGLLAWVRGLYGHCPQAYLLSVTGAAFGYREGLSPQVEAALPAALAQAGALLHLEKETAHA
ncbi:MAG: hydrogenase maturation protease [Candidatus Latescibacteria bacterium]|nr:hydrogenase maturation protease [Candidatus Latescibacterota bacterium]